MTSVSISISDFLYKIWIEYNYTREVELKLHFGIDIMR